MANKNCNVQYDQIPHIVINHPDTTMDHEGIMGRLYKILKDKSICTYSNEALALACNTSESTIKRRLAELKCMGFINIHGQGYSRRISLGSLFL